LYATTMPAPKTMNTSSHSVDPMATWTPIAHAPAIDHAASPTSTRSGMRVRSGRLFISSSACAPMPIARKNASTVQPRRPHFMCGATAAPSAAYDRCHSVYGGWSSVT
jgi:hypothetical protein